MLHQLLRDLNTNLFDISIFFWEFMQIINEYKIYPKYIIRREMFS